MALSLTWVTFSNTLMSRAITFVLAGLHIGRLIPSAKEEHDDAHRPP